MSLERLLEFFRGAIMPLWVGFIFREFPGVIVGVLWNAKRCEATANGLPHVIALESYQEPALTLSWIVYQSSSYQPIRSHTYCLPNIFCLKSTRSFYSSGRHPPEVSNFLAMKVMILPIDVRLTCRLRKIHDERPPRKTFPR